MTPKQHAEKIINEYLPIFDLVEGYSVSQMASYCENKAKECALICVNEIIKQSENWGVVSVRYYWKNVKKEIENY